MTISGTVTAGLPINTGAKPDSPERVHEAAQQFESLLIGSMLKSMNDAGESWLGTDGDEAGSTAVEMAQEQFAQALSQRGGLGLAKLVETGLQRAAAKSQAPGTVPQHERE